MKKYEMTPNKKNELYQIRTLIDIKSDHVKAGSWWMD